ncbi:MAG: hypothetical protein Q8L69_12670, partial [Gallionellaceae bacterium]|nr:hypothetical protein [Gallionellaceae bacterium]
GFTCQHSGTYEDPISAKTREFDIRAVKESTIRDNLKFRLCLSVECKNIRENFPLVVHCMPRESSESFMDLICSSKPTRQLFPYAKYSECLKLNADPCAYKPQDPVGKSCDQVGRRNSSDGELVGNDGDVFDKISQAINSSYDLIKECHYAGNDGVTVVSAVVPILVVPNERIWTVWYDKNGNIEVGPSQTEHVAYYMDKSWEVGGEGERKQSYQLSHMEIVQFDSIESLVNNHLQIEEYLRRHFANAANQA